MPAPQGRSDADPNRHTEARRDQMVALSLAAAILILLIVFVVLFVQIDPLLSDLTRSGAVTPVDGTPFSATPAASPNP